MFSALSLAPNDTTQLTAAQAWRSDIAAGLTTATMLVPQSMAYALLAGLEPIYGLYASTVPLFVYAVLGTSRQLAVGPGAMLSILTCSAIAAAKTNAELANVSAISIATQLMFLVGCLEIVFGLIRLGSLVQKLPRSVIVGFTYAAAILIMTSQLKHLTRLQLPRGSFFATWLRLLSQCTQWHLPTMALALFCIVALIMLKRVNKMWPRQLIVIAVITVLVNWFRLDAQGLDIVGEIPQALPWPPVYPMVSWISIATLFPYAVTMSLVSFMEAYSGSTNFAKLDGAEIKPNQEFVSLGFANLAGSLFQGFPITGGLARTAVNAGAGAKTTRASIITASVVILTLLFLTDLFRYLPKAALSSVIVVAIVQLFNLEELKHLLSKSEFSKVLLIVTFIVTLVFGIEKGLLAGVVLTVVGNLFHSSSDDDLDNTSAETKQTAVTTQQSFMGQTALTTDAD